MVRRSKSGKIIKFILGGFLAAVTVLYLLWMRSSCFPKTGQYNIYLSSDKIYLFSLKPSLGEIVIGSIDNATEVDVPLGYGTYQAQALGNLDYQETKEKTVKQGEIIKKAILNNYYFFPSAYVLYLKDGDKMIFNKIIKNQASIFDLILFWRQIKNGRVETNLSSYDIFHIYRLIKTVPKNKIKVFDFPDKEKFGQEFSLLVSNLSVNWEIRKENLEISLVNGAGKQGLAAFSEKVIESLGADVTSVSNMDKNSNKTICQINKPSLSRSETYLYLKEIFNCSLLEKKNADGSDIKLIIGNDFAF